MVGNLKPAHTKPHALLKAEIIERAARLMVDLGIDTVEDLRTTVETSPQDNPVHTGWKKLPSQSSGVTYNYLLILAGMLSVKPDRMILRFLASALGEDADLSFDRAVELIRAAADELEVSSRTLDHIVWRAASGRELVDQSSRRRIARDARRVPTIELAGRLFCQSAAEIAPVTELLPQHIDLTRAEPGCISFDVEPNGDPGVWDVSERFRDTASFEAHQVRVKGLFTIQSVDGV